MYGTLHYLFALHIIWILYTEIDRDSSNSGHVLQGLVQGQFILLFQLFFLIIFLKSTIHVITVLSVDAVFCAASPKFQHPIPYKAKDIDNIYNRVWKKVALWCLVWFEGVMMVKWFCPCPYLVQNFFFRFSFLPM